MPILDFHHARFAVDLGLNADFTLDQNNVISTYLQHDISGAYKGYLAGATYFHIMKFGSVDFVPFANLTYQSEGFVFVDEIVAHFSKVVVV